MARGLLPLLLVVILITETWCKNNTEALIHTAYDKLITRRIIAKREAKCKMDEYIAGDECCKKCERGFVKNVGCPSDTSEHCVPCTNGKDYMDHVNDLDKCLRCSSCDSIFDGDSFIIYTENRSRLINLLPYLSTEYISQRDTIEGPQEELNFLSVEKSLEVAKNCTPAQNTECTCAKNHFCNSSVPCRHCDPCTICKSGVTEKECTPTSDTVCGMEGVPAWAIACIIVLVLFVPAGAILWWKRKQMGCTSKENLGEVIPTTKFPHDNEPLIYPDIDLSSHTAAIVEEMTLSQVKTFVRCHQISEPVIDQTLRDNQSDTSEQKIKLFEVWYQRHGMKRAYGTLIISLRELKMCTIADRIELKLKPAICSSQEGGQSYSDDTDQSKTCNPESTNSYNDSAELSKINSGSLEET